MKLLFSCTFFVGVFSLLVFSSCERASVQSSVVSLQLPSISESGQIQKTNGTLSSCTICLKAAVVRASGAGFNPVQLQRYHENMDVADAQLDSEITLEVPIGSQRHFQILALYRNAGGTLKVYHGSSYADLNAEAAKVDIQLNFIGNLGGSLMGRYLTSADEGPTGKVNISYEHPSGLSFDGLPGGEIINGWFDFYAGNGVDLIYRLENDKAPLFSDVKSTSTNGFKDYIDQNSTAGVFRQIAHISRPKNDYWIKNGTFPYERVSEVNDLVYGYFGEPGVDLSAKKVCIQPIAGATSLDNTSVSASSGDISLSFRSNVYGVSLTNAQIARTIFGSGGAASGDCTTVSSDLVYDADQITLVKDQYNGRGNDHARAIAGAFTYIVSYDSTLASSDPSSAGYKVMKYEHDRSTVEYKLRGLPEVFSGNKPVYNSIRLFKKTNAANGGYDNIDCHEKWLDAKGFSEVTNFSQPPQLFTWAPAENNIKFTLNFNPNGTDGYVACPANGTDMNNIGGMYLGALGPITEPIVSIPANLNFVPAPVFSTPTQDLTILNVGSVPIRNLANSMVSGDVAQLQILSSNCPNDLPPGNNCQITVKYYATSVPASHSANLQIQFNAGAETRFVMVMVTATTIDP